MAENTIDHVYFDPFYSSAISVHSYCDYVPYLANAWILISLMFFHSCKGYNQFWQVSLD